MISHLSKVARRTFSSTSRAEIKKIGVIGMGSMGHGIVQLSAQNGYEVVAVDLDQKVIDHAMGAINGSLDKLQAKGKLTEEAVATARANIVTSTDVGAAAEDCDLIIEAIVENLPIKLDFYKNLGSIFYKSLKSRYYRQLSKSLIKDNTSREKLYSVIKE